MYYKAQFSQADTQKNSHLASVETSRIRVRCVLGLVRAEERPIVERDCVNLNINPCSSFLFFLSSVVFKEMWAEASKYNRRCTLV